MKTKYRITEKNGLYKIEKWLSDDCTGEMDKQDLDELLGYQLHAHQLTSKTQRKIKALLDSSMANSK
jgi:hypothetical protein